MQSIPQHSNRVPVLRERIAANPCESLTVPADVPVITLNVSDFVEALTKRKDEDSPTALACLNGILTYVASLHEPIKCVNCNGTGIDDDPFMDDRPRIKDDRACLDNVAAVSALVADLRAALEYAKGGPNS